MGINLKAYRFAESELKQMIQLRKLFESNHLITDRFPEVYYDTFEKYELIFGKQKATHEDEPDYLGVYHYKHNRELTKTLEGVIILFKDRIEDFCIRLSLGVDDVRFIVLMHEMGHWLTHWSKCNDQNWEKGYISDHKKTHESLAQLIAYWSVYRNPRLKKILNKHLTPSNKNNEYALYLLLVKLQKSVVLKKLIEIRNYYFLDSQFITEHKLDEIYFNFLNSRFVDFFDFFTQEKNIAENLRLINNCEISEDDIERLVKVNFYNRLFTIAIKFGDKNIEKGIPPFLCESLKDETVLNEKLIDYINSQNHKTKYNAKKYGL
jgi:hypothetical protein